MIQIEVEHPGGPEVLIAREAPVPSVKPGHILIKVHAAGVNRPDLLQRQGAYPPPPDASPILGLEVAGDVEEIGSNVSNWRKGDRVCALVNGGGYAEYASAPAGQCLPLPSNLDWTEAAALPETFFTVWANVFQIGALKPGERFLVHGGSSGIGTVAIQLAHAFGAEVFATAGDPRKLQACRALGADTAINYKESDFVAEIRNRTAGIGVDVILDMVGGGYTARNLACLAPHGRLVQIAFLQGSRVELDLRPVLTKRLVITGSALRPRTAEEKAGIASELLMQVWPLLQSGKIRPVIDRAFPLREAAGAHRYLEAGEHIGKVMLTI